METFNDNHFLLQTDTAQKLYHGFAAKQPIIDYHCLMKKYGVEVVCTTEDPIDTQVHHIKTKNDGFEIKLLPTWRPDRAMAVENPSAFRSYTDLLAKTRVLQ